MASTLAPVGTPERFEQVKARIDRRSHFMLLATVILLALSIWQSFRDQQVSSALGRLIITASDVRPLGSTAVCPGEIMQYQYTLHVGDDNGATVEMDRTVWSLDAEQTVFESIPTRRILRGPTEVVIENWRVELDQTTLRQLAPWAPGNYERRVSYRNTFQTTSSGQFAIEFRIRGDCD